jgi:hypothetical protein
MHRKKTQLHRMRAKQDLPVRFRFQLKTLPRYKRGVVSLTLELAWKLEGTQELLVWVKPFEMYNGDLLSGL